MFSIRTVFSFIASVVSSVVAFGRQSPVVYAPKLQRRSASTTSLLSVVLTVLTVATVVSITATTVHAQVEPPAVEWKRVYSTGRDHGVSSVQQTSDGGYVMAGHIVPLGPSGYTDVYLVKTDSSGKLVWQQTYGGKSFDHGHSVQQTTDGGYIVAGYTYTDTGTPHADYYRPGPGASSYDVYLVKTDSSGKLVWQQTYDGGWDDEGYSVQQTNDGGYVVAGETGTPDGTAVYLVKTDALGKLVWQQTYGREGEYGFLNEHHGRSVQQTTDGGYIVAVKSFFSGTDPGSVFDHDVCLIKTDSSGKQVWRQTYGGAQNDVGESVQQTTDGGYVVAGLTSSLSASKNSDVHLYLYLVKTDSSGKLVWQQTCGGIGDGKASLVQPTKDGGYIVAGRLASSKPYRLYESDLYLVKFSSKKSPPAK